MYFEEGNLETSIVNTQKEIREANDELLNAENSFASNNLKAKIEKLTKRLQKHLKELKSINPNNSFLNLEDSSLIEESFEVNKDFKLEAGTLDPETNKITFRSILIGGEEKPHSFVISDGTEENILLIEDVVSMKQLSEESSRSFLGTAAKGLGGLILLGPIGLLAGVLTKKKKTSTFLGIEFNDGNKIICSINKDSKILNKLQSSLMKKYEF